MPNGYSNVTHCVAGHEFTEENTYVEPTGKRVCRSCARRRTREWKEKNPYVPKEVDTRRGKDLTGLKVNMLTVVSFSHRDEKRNQHWNCLCDCGGTSIVNRSNLQGTDTQVSCGCIKYVLDAAFKKVFSQYQTGAKKRALAFELTEEQFRKLTSSPCYYTGRAPSAVKTTKADSYVWNGIDRLDNTLGYTIENCVPCCAEINYAKRALSKSAFIEMCIEVAKQHGQKASRTCRPAWFHRLTRRQQVSWTFGPTSRC
jgi:hypothetical protein